MAPDTSSSLTSTSHTLTAFPAMASLASKKDSAPTVLLDSLQPANRHVFLQPSAAIPTESLELVKNTLEDFAGDVADEQQQLLKESRKRKRGGERKGDVLKVRKVHIDGFETNQVWQQAKRIIEGVLKHADEALDDLQDKNEIHVNGLSDNGSASELDHLEEGDATDDETDRDSDENEREAFIDVEALEDEDGEEDDWEDATEGLGDANGPEASESDGEDGEDGEYDADPDGLNDGFFSIDDFNRQSQWFEDQDARGDPYTDQASEDEAIDWGADPLAPSKADSNPSKKGEEDASIQDEDEDDEEEGPTFGDMALDAPEGDSEDEAMQDELDGDLEDGADEGNANEVYYKDFFAPPKKKSTGKKPKKSVHFRPQKPDDREVERAMADVRRDLFDDLSDQEDSEDALSDASAGDPRSRRSAHERRQAKLSEQIRKLEAESITKREWVMSGEAAGVDRPVNSLLEHDLDFEHGGKPVPVITPEISESIEDLIKRRILAREFDEVIKRRPGTENMDPSTRRGMLEDVDDTKGKSLAEVYEEQHAKQDNPDTYVSKSDEKLQREEREVETMWRDVSAKLDALSSWHYRPRPTEPSLSVVADVATIAMEDAQPATAAGLHGEQSRMAPQEIYSASGKTAEKGEVVSRGGLPTARQEMSREDKIRRRRREKERVRKAGGVAGGKTLSKRAQMQKDTVSDLKKGGVKVINRKGEVTDVEGNKVKSAKIASSKNYKL